MTKVEYVKDLGSEFVLVQDYSEVVDTQVDNGWNNGEYNYLFVNAVDGEYVSVYGSYGVNLADVVTKLV